MAKFDTPHQAPPSPEPSKDKLKKDSKAARKAAQDDPFLDVVESEEREAELKARQKHYDELNRKLINKKQVESEIFLNEAGLSTHLLDKDVDWNPDNSHVAGKNRVVLELIKKSGPKAYVQKVIVERKAKPNIKKAELVAGDKDFPINEYVSDYEYKLTPVDDQPLMFTIMETDEGPKIVGMY